MRPAALQPRRRDVPLGLGEVELRPAGADHLRLPTHGVRQELRRRDRHEVRTLSGDRVPECAEFLFVEVPVMLRSRHVDHATQRQRGVGLDDQLLDRVVVELLDDDPHAFRRVGRASTGFENFQHVARFHFVERLVADGGPDEAFEARQYLGPVALGARTEALRDPALRERLDIVSGPFGLDSCFQFLAFLRDLHGGILTPLDELPQLEVTIAGIGHADLGVAPDAQVAGRAAQHVAKAPGLDAAGHHLHVQPAAVGELVGPCLALDVVDSGGCERVVQVSHEVLVSGLQPFPVSGKFAGKRGRRFLAISHFPGGFRGQA